MATKECALLLVHGMGEHTAPTFDAAGKLTKQGSFRQEFTKACNAALNRYQQHKNDSIDNHVDVYEFNYNEWFDDVRRMMSERAKPVSERMKAVGAKFGVTFALDLVGELASFESRYGEDEFFYTHWLDVLFYATLLGAKVRVDAGREIAKLVRTYGQSRVHIFAHSLGTAVVHDTLALLYRPESDPDGRIPDLRLTEDKLASVWMVANVSRLVNAASGIADPLKSTVRPGNSGCTNVFNNVRHRLDPFTWVSCFDPGNNGKWIPERIYDMFYSETVTELITNPNTHDITQYIEDPRVAEKLLQQLIKFKWTLDDLEKARAQYRDRSIQGAYAAIEQELSDLSKKDLSSWRDFFEAGENLSAAIKLVKGTFA